MKKTFFSFPRFNFTMLSLDSTPVISEDGERAVIRISDTSCAFFFDVEGFRIDGTKEEIDMAIATHLSGGVITINE